MTGVCQYEIGVWMVQTAFSLEEILRKSERGDDCLDVLILCDDSYPNPIIADHVDAFRRHSRHRVSVRRPWKNFVAPGEFHAQPTVDLVTDAGTVFDVVVIHYSLCILYEDLFPSYLFEVLREYSGIKIQVIQDEYRWVDRMMASMVDLGIHAIVSALVTEQLDVVYRHPALKNVVKVSALPGYVNRDWAARTAPAIRERKRHLVYRGNALPYWMGHTAREKTTLGDRIQSGLDRARNTWPGVNLIVDVSSSPDERIYGEDWLEFTMSAKAVVALEGGASIFDFEDATHPVPFRDACLPLGRIEKRVNTYLAGNPRASYEEVHGLFLEPYEGNVVHRVITPRCFEAISVRTSLVLLVGEYNGILQPWRHYIPLQRDFSNFGRVCELLGDDHYLQELADRAYEEIITPGEYDESILGKGMDAIVDYLR